MPLIEESIRGGPVPPRRESSHPVHGSEHGSDASEPHVPRSGRLDGNDVANGRLGQRRDRFLRERQAAANRLQCRADALIVRSDARRGRSSAAHREMIRSGACLPVI